MGGKLSRLIRKKEKTTEKKGTVVVEKNEVEQVESTGCFGCFAFFKRGPKIEIEAEKTEKIKFSFSCCSAD